MDVQKIQNNNYNLNFGKINQIKCTGLYSRRDAYPALIINKVIGSEDFTAYAKKYNFNIVIHFLKKQLFIFLKPVELKSSKQNYFNLNRIFPRKASENVANILSTAAEDQAVNLPKKIEAFWGSDHGYSYDRNFTNFGEDLDETLKNFFLGEKIEKSLRKAILEQLKQNLQETKIPISWL